MSVPRKFANVPPEKIAALLLVEHGGVQRDAERAAWELLEQFTPDAPGRQCFTAAVIHIVSGTESPEITRQDARPTSYGAPVAVS